MSVGLCVPIYLYIIIIYNIQFTVLKATGNERGWRRSSDFGLFFVYLKDIIVKLAVYINYIAVKRHVIGIAVHVGISYYIKIITKLGYSRFYNNIIFRTGHLASKIMAVKQLRCNIHR